MALNGQFGIGILLKGEDQVTPAAKKAGVSMKTLSGTVDTAAHGMSAAMKLVAVGTGVMVAGFQALKGAFGIAVQAGEFKQEMAAVGAIMGANVTMFKKLEAAAISAGLKTQFAPKEAAQALRALGQAGLKGNDAIKALVPSLDLAAASLGKLGPARATGTVNAALKTFGLRADEARKAVDAMVFTTNNFNISIEQLPLAIGNVSRGAISLKQNMNDTMILLGLVKNVLPEISSAATLTSSAMLRIADQKTQKKLKKLGVTFADSAGKFLPALQIFMNIDNVLQKRFKKLNVRAAKIGDLLGKRAISPFLAAVQQMRNGVASLPAAFNKGNVAFKVLQLRAKAAQGDMKAVAQLAKMGLPKAFVEGAKRAAKEGASKKFVKALLNTFTGQLTLLKGAFGSFLVSIGAPLTRVFGPFVSGLFKGFSILANQINAINPSLKAAIATFVILAIVIGTATGALLAFNAASAVTAAFLAPILAPLLLIIKGIVILAGVVAGLVLLWQSDFLGLASTTKDFFSAIWEGVTLTAGPALKELKAIFSAAWTEISLGMQALKLILIDLGAISTDTTVGMSEGFRLMATFIGATLGSVIKIIVFVIKMFAFVIKLAGAFGSAIGNKLAGGKFEFKVPDFTITKEKKVTSINKGSIPGGAGQVASGGGVFPRFERGQRAGQFVQSPDPRILVQQAPTQAPAQKVDVTVKGTANIGDSAVKFMFEKKQERKKAGFSNS